LYSIPCMSQALEQLLRELPQVWTGRQLAQVQTRSTGFRELNALLPGYGWPQSALIELIPQAEGIGELSLLLPALNQLCREARDIVFIRPPHIPYPPALVQAGLPLSRVLWIEANDDVEARWAAEQTLHEGLAGAVLLWSDCSKDVPLRRLQLATRDGEALSFIYRSTAFAAAASLAAVRLKLLPDEHGMRVEVLKAQGGRTGKTVLNLHAAA
jgi:cell division inhibitor SulA